MKYVHSKFAEIIYFFLATLSLCWCIYRDIQIEKQYPGDLRNRVVGARLQMDGVSPYFYHWSQGEGVRYYDPEIHNTTLKISNVTASPFFHQLLYPIANLQQRTISRIWLGVEYLALLVMTVLALRLAKEKKQRWLVIFTSLFFLYTYAWTTHVDVGQLYIFIPLLAMAFYFFISRPQNLLNATLAGLCAITLILVRPNTLIFFFPFIFLARRYSGKYIIAFLLTFLVILLVAFHTSDARLYWSDYRKAVGEQVKGHQGLDPTQQVVAPFARYAGWEGWDTLQITRDVSRFHYQQSGENGNVFVFLNHVLNVKTPIWVLSGLCVAFIMLLLGLFYKKYSKPPYFDAFSIALLGYCMYMASDLFSPIYRALYNTSQWIFPLLLIASAGSRFVNKIFIAGILTGLFLNCLSYRIIPMQNSIGEYLIFASVLGILLTRNPAIQK